MGKKRFAVTSQSSNWKHDYSHYANQDIETHTRGWDLGVIVTGRTIVGNFDEFTIEITKGSHNHSSTGPILRVFESAEGTMLDVQGEVVNLSDYIEKGVTA